MSEEAGDNSGHNDMTPGVRLRVEVEFPEILAAGRRVGVGRCLAVSSQHPAEVNQPDISDLAGVGDVQQLEPLAGGGDHVQQVVGGHVVQVEAGQVAACLLYTSPSPRD